MARERDAQGNSVWRPFGSNLIPDELAGNVYRIARALAAQGHSADYIRERLGGRKRATDLATVERATNLAMTWQQRLKDLTAQGPDTKIPRAFMTRNQGLADIPTAYRWLVQLELVGRSRGGGRRDPSQFRMIAVNSDRNLTMQEIADLAAANWDAIRGNSNPRSRESNQLTKALILTAERRSG